MKWVERNTVDLSELTKASLVRQVLDALATTLDGREASAATVSSKRAVFSCALRYAVELGRFDAHPMDKVKWSAPKITDEMDRRVVPNPAQARRLLDATEETTPELAAFFGAMYYAALRPEEALNLREHEYERPKEEGGWGWLHLTGSVVVVGKGWNDDDQEDEYRGLKHRPKKAVRDVPAPPALCAMLDRHIENFKPWSDGRLFYTRRGPGGLYVASLGRPVSNNSYGTAFRKARSLAFTPEEQKSPLAYVPYHLRHACVSYWLNMGAPVTLVAKWAGHSPYVLWKIYAKCVWGEEGAAMQRIQDGYDSPPTPGASAGDPSSPGPEGPVDPGFAGPK